LRGKGGLGRERRGGVRGKRGIPSGTPRGPSRQGSGGPGPAPLSRSGTARGPRTGACPPRTHPRPRTRRTSYPTEAPNSAPRRPTCRSSPAATRSWWCPTSTTPWCGSPDTPPHLQTGALRDALDPPAEVLGAFGAAIPAVGPPRPGTRPLRGRYRPLPPTPSRGPPRARPLPDPGMPPTCPPPRIPREGPTPSRRGPPPPRRPQVAHDDPEHTALKEFNALWKRSCAPSGLLVFSTGRSLAKYHQLRAFAPDLQVRRAPDAGGGRGPATPAPPAARPGPAAALAGAQSPRATAPPTPPAPGTRHPPPPRARSTRTCSCAPSGRRSTTWARGSRRWTRAGWRTCPRGGTAPHARPWPRASRPWRPRSRRSSAPTSCPTRSMGAPGRARPSQRGSRAP